MNGDDHSIPRSAMYWYFFKRHILEKDHVLVEFSQKELDRKSYKELLLLHANPCVYGPQFCRSKNAETRRNINELVSVTFRYCKALLAPRSPITVKRSQVANGSLGVFLNDGHNFVCIQESNVLQRELFGLALFVSKEDFEALHAAGHHSLMNSNGKPILFIGPLSLVNHECNGAFCFSKQHVMPTETQEFQGMPMIHVFVRRDCTLAGGSEILIDYFNQAPCVRPATVFGHVCKCPSCNV